MSLNLIPSSNETIHGIAQDIAAKRRSCVEVLESCLAKIDEWEPRVKAWVSLDRAGAKKLAEDRDRELAQGKHYGPLHGIPIGIKDIIDIAGLPTACGSALMAQTVAAKDAAVVARLCEAGAIILGKTVTTQFASFDPPVTRNPWNIERTPGGSSSGSAAATATGMCLAAIGSQTGGSITRPASFCGVAGCKPTWGRVSTRGVFPLAPSMDHVGPIARSVRDMAILLDVISGFDSGDLLSANVPATKLCAMLDQSLSVPRLGVLGGDFEDRAELATRDATRSAISALKTAGAHVAEARLPVTLDEILKRHRLIMATEAASYHEERLRNHPDDYRPHIRALVEEGLNVSAAEYIRCRRHQLELSHELVAAFESFDVLICPSTVGAAPDTSSTGNPSFNSPWSYTGLPTITIPIALDGGLPLGLQFIARRFDEGVLFRAAAWCESRLASKSVEPRTE